MAAPLALYRRYRPETFAEVIGQDHVTTPLRAALANNRVNHAYLFSGPRGCGKTTSARILARALNCAKAPISDPCGECDSCRDLARGGPGSIDVIEIDAASHNGVDDARDLRERAFFSPVRDRYKVYIIDEAHMVTTAAFNALLKLVEEPPPHVRFIFATTEPDKVLPTIRSRTHHYPFRLVPPRLLTSYVGEICEREGVKVDPAALSLVVRAGGGSVRDTLSVMDQLLGGAGDDGVTYALASGLLGYTPDTLLDDIVNAFAANDSHGVFTVIDHIIEAGHDPKRFAEDLLHRFRDLVVIAAVPNAIDSGLIDTTPDAGPRLARQATSLGAQRLTQAADTVAAGLVDMRGATAPRLLLELICARVLYPTHAVATAPQASVSSAAPPVVAAPVPPAPPTPTPPVIAEAAAAERREAPPEATGPSEVRDAGVRSSALTLVDVNRMWGEVVEEVKRRGKRVAWIHLTQNSKPVAFDNDTVSLGFANAGSRDSFANGGYDEVTAEAAHSVLGVQWRISAIVDGAFTPTTPPPPSAPEPPAEAEAPEWVAPEPPPISDASDDDASDDDDTVSTEELLASKLGATLIEEIPNA